MGLPPVATIAACGSIITAIKSSWELSRMVKKKDRETRLDTEAKKLLRDLQNLLVEKAISERSFDKWYDRLLGALADKDSIELEKIRQHVNLVIRDKARLTRRNTYSNKTIHLDDTHDYRRQSQTRDRKRSRSSRPEYSVYEYEEEEKVRPNHVDTAKARRDHYYAHALPSPYKGEIEYTPLEAGFDKGEERRGRHRHRESSSSSRTESYQARSNSVVDRGRTRSRSITTEKKVLDTSSDADSEGEKFYDRRRSSYYPPSSSSNTSKGRTRSRSITTEKKVLDTSPEVDSEGEKFHDRRRSSYYPPSSSTTSKGRTRSRSVTTAEKRILDSSSDGNSSDEAYYDRRRSTYYSNSSSTGGRGSGSRR